MLIYTYKAFLRNEITTSKEASISYFYLKTLGQLHLLGLSNNSLPPLGMTSPALVMICCKIFVKFKFYTLKYLICY